jgi:hypothetical protein
VRHEQELERLRTRQRPSLLYQLSVFAGPCLPAIGKDFH